MKKFLPLLLFFASLTNSATHDTKQEFLRLYYTGKYEEAHAIVKEAAYDTATRSGWEARLHVHERFSGCKFESDASSRGIAMLRIGMIDQAIGHFGQDWLSFLGRAKLAGWNNEIEIGREFIRKAIQLKPEQPDLYFYAALYARTDEEALNYFERYLKTHPPDTSKRSSARQAIEFFAKTKGIRLNHANLASPVERIDSNFDHRRLTFRAKIDNKPDVVLLMDTGAAGLSLKDKSWRARNTTDFLMIGLGTKQQTRASLMVFNEFSSGGFRIKNPVAAVTRNLQSAGIDGIAGTIIFSDYKIVLPSRKDSQVMLSTMDTNQLLNHLKQEGFVYKQQTTLPFYQVGKMMILKGRIKKSDNEMDILLDTGAQASILSAATARKHVYINYPKRRTLLFLRSVFG